MINTDIRQYQGKLTAAEIAAGINAANKNALRLAEDAQVLLDVKSYATAASLATLSIEESGKSSILRQLATSPTDAEIKECWKSYRTHTKKNVQWLLPQLAVEGARKLDDFKTLYEPSASHPKALDTVKQLGFYTDCVGPKNWSIPGDIIGEPLASGLVKLAKLLVGKREISALEIELWTVHIGPAPKEDFEASKKALIEWYAAMQDAGLRPAGLNEMQIFINDGVNLPAV